MEWRKSGVIQTIIYFISLMLVISLIVTTCGLNPATIALLLINIGLLVNSVTEMTRVD